MRSNKSKQWLHFAYIQQITSLASKKSLSCSHAIYAVRSIVEYFTRYDSTVNLCAIDLSKAFDKVNLCALFIKLMNRNIPVELLSVIEVLCSDCFICVKWFDAWSISFKVNFGVRQGSVFAPYLFALYIPKRFS